MQGRSETLGDGNVAVFREVRVVAIMLASYNKIVNNLYNKLAPFILMPDWNAG